MKALSERTLREQAAGRLLTTQAMLNGLIDQICTDYKINRFATILNTDGDDPRKWTITVTLKGGITHTENAWEFPTDELKAIIMLIER